MHMMKCCIFFEMTHLQQPCPLLFLLRFNTMLINNNTDIYTSKRFLDDTPHLKFPLSSEL